MSNQKSKGDESATVERPGAVPYAAKGHPSLEQLRIEQGTKPIKNLGELRGESWPDDEFEDFLAALREWRGHGPGQQS
jgi:hypothetical protein